MIGDPDGIRTHETNYLRTEFPVDVDVPRITRCSGRVMASTLRKVDQELLDALRNRPAGASLRELASLHGVSHETIRRALALLDGTPGLILGD